VFGSCSDFRRFGSTGFSNDKRKCCYFSIRRHEAAGGKIGVD
jgi:hypothetical protein